MVKLPFYCNLFILWRFIEELIAGLNYFNMKKITFLLAGFLLFNYTCFCCTIVSCARNGQVFAAGNEDDYLSTLYARVWFNPPTNGHYGMVSFGLPDLQAQTIMNEYGLFVDFTAQYSINPSKFNIQHPYYGDLFFEILSTCKNVKEALAFLKDHQYAYSSQALLADAEGNSVIVNVEANTIKEGDYQVNTNFNICDLKKGVSDRRYNIAKEMLSGHANLSVGYFRDILNRTHQEGNLTTLYSYVFDIKKGLIYVYFFHNFDNAWVIDIKKELKKDYRLENLADHFPTSYAYETLIQKDPGYKKEQVLAEIYTKGADNVITKYLSDTSLYSTMLEVGLQLVKDAWNQQGNGGMWLYWFGLPGGYSVQHFTDSRLNAAQRIFTSLLQRRAPDIKLKNFMIEIEAYINLVQGNTKEAKYLYEQASASQNDAYPLSYNRAKEMLREIGMNN